MASGFQLRVAASTALNSLGFVREYVSPLDNPNLMAALRTVESYLNGIAEEPEFIDRPKLDDAQISQVKHQISEAIGEYDSKRRA